jgi:hypothetical protein
METVNWAFDVKKEDIEQKSLKAMSLLRQAESALDKICAYTDELSAFVEGQCKAEVTMEIGPNNLGRR